jgi:bacterioferritin (cytochrome b1)
MDNQQTTAAVDQLNSLLRGEIAATETYRMAIDKIAGDRASDVGLLQSIQEEHGRNAQTIRSRIRELDGQPADASGAWGAWAKTVQGMADLLGQAACIKSLKEGEEHGLKEYETAAGAVDAQSSQLIRNQLLPAQKKHIDLLDQLIAQPKQ